MAGRQQYIRVSRGIEPTLKMLAKRQGMARSEENFIRALLSLFGQADGEGLSVPRKELLDKMNSYAETPKEQLTTSGLTRLLNKLRGAGAIEDIKPRGERFTILDLTHRIENYFLGKDEPLSIVVGAQPYAKKARQQRDALENSDALILLDSPQANYAMRLMHGILHGFVRADRYDYRKVITRTPRRIRIRNAAGDVVSEEISIETSCRSHDRSAIMEFADSAIISALNAMYVEGVIRRFGPKPDPKDIPRHFVFDIFDLCDALGVTRNNRHTVARRLQRVRDTMFTIHMKDAPEFRRTFAFGGQDVVEFQYLTEFGYATEELLESKSPIDSSMFSEAITDQDDLFGDILYDQDKGLLIRNVPRFYFVSFSVYHFYYLMQNPQEHRFAYPTELMKTRNPALLGLAYSWARGFVGSRQDPAFGGSVTMTFDEYWRHVAPVSSRDTFYKLFRAMMEQFLVDRAESYDPEGVNLANLMGYFMESDHRPERLDTYYKRYPSKRPRRRGPASKKDALITIYRDKDDPLVGDNSVHNQLIRQQSLVKEY